MASTRGDGVRDVVGGSLPYDDKQVATVLNRCVTGTLAESTEIGIEQRSGGAGPLFEDHPAAAVMVASCRIQPRHSHDPQR
jgi:hypothetical protein